MANLCEVALALSPSSLYRSAPLILYTSGLLSLYLFTPFTTLYHSTLYSTLYPSGPLSIYIFTPFTALYHPTLYPLYPLDLYL